MPATNTAINGCDAVLLLDNAAGTPIDVSGSGNNVDLGLNVDIESFKVFGQPWGKRLSCGRDGSLAVRFVYTTAADEGMDLLKDWYFNNHTVARTFTIQLPDGSIGSDQFSAEWLIEDLSFPFGAESAGPIMVEASLLPDGEIFYSVVS